MYYNTHMGYFILKCDVHMLILEVAKLIEWMMSVSHNELECRF